MDWWANRLTEETNIKNGKKVIVNGGHGQSLVHNDQFNPITSLYDQSVCDVTQSHGNLLSGKLPEVETFESENKTTK